MLSPVTLLLQSLSCNKQSLIDAVVFDTQYSILNFKLIANLDLLPEHHEEFSAVLETLLLKVNLREVALRRCYTGTNHDCYV